MPGEEAQQQARAGAGIAEIERPVGLAEAADAHALDPPPAARVTLDGDAERGAAPAAVASTSAPSSRPLMRLSPTAMAASISARCEIDLSPGTVVDPLSRPAG